MTTKITCFGDSIMQGNDNGIWPSLFQDYLEQWQPGAYHVINSGHSGDTTVHGFDRLEAFVIPNLPGTVIIEFGINDCNHRPWAKVPRIGLAEFEKNLREFYRIITERGGRCIWIVNHPLNPTQGKYTHQGNGLHYQENLVPYNAVIRQIAEETGSCLIDIPAMLGEKGINLAEFLANDGVHLSPYGTEMYATIVFERFREIMND